MFYIYRSKNFHACKHSTHVHTYTCVWTHAHTYTHTHTHTHTHITLSPHPHISLTHNVHVHKSTIGAGNIRHSHSIPPLISIHHRMHTQTHFRCRDREIVPFVRFSGDNNPSLLPTATADNVNGGVEGPLNVSGGDVWLCTRDRE